MTNLSIYRNGDYDQFDASTEIIAAIEEIAGDDILDEESDAHRIWAEPSSSEESRVKTLAWSMTDDPEDTLYWGGALKRPA